MALRYSVADGNWSNVATWDGGATTPQNGDAVEIRDTHDVTIDAEINVISTCTIKNGGKLIPAFAMSTSAFANITIDSGGTLYASRSVTSFLRVTGKITSNSSSPIGINYGTAADPISDNSITAFIEFVCFQDNQSTCGIVTGAVGPTVSFYGATRTWSTTLASVAALTDTHIHVADNLSLRGGTAANWANGLVDAVIVGHTPTQTNNGALHDEIDVYLVASTGDAGLTINLADIGAGQSYFPRGGTTPNWNDIHQTQREIGTPVYLLSANVGIRGTAYNLRPSYGISCNLTSHQIVFQNAFALWCYAGISSGSSNTISGAIAGCNNGLTGGTGHTISGTIVGCSNGIGTCSGATISANICGCSNGFASSSDHTISGTISGCSTGVYGGTGHMISGTIAGCSTGVYGGQGHTISGTISGCSNGIIAGAGATVSGTISKCIYGIINSSYNTISGTISGCTTGINAGSGNTIDNCIFDTNTYDLRIINSAKMNNCSMGTTEFYEYNITGRLSYHYVESLNHDQATDAFKAWCRGGIVTKAANVVPSGKSYSYEHACESASYPVFQQFEITLEAGQTITFQANVRKTVTMSYLPRIWIIDYYKDPLAIASYSVLDEAIMTNSVDTWELLSCDYTNTDVIPKKIILRAMAKNASGTVYFYPDIVESTGGGGAQIVGRGSPIVRGLA